MGEYTFDRTDDSAHKDFRVDEIRIHDQYSTTTYVNDIAIIKLSQTTSFNGDIWPVCLPEPNDLYVNRIATVVGMYIYFFYNF